jgi:hypothetical protein
MRTSRIAIRPAGVSLHDLQGSVDGALRDIAKFLQSWSLYDSLRPVRAARGWRYAPGYFLRDRPLLGVDLLRGDRPARCCRLSGAALEVCMAVAVAHGG